MPSFPIVEFDPSCNCLIGLLDAFEVVVPDTLFFDRPEESFDHTVLFRGIGCDKLLLESVRLDGLGKRPTAKDQAVVASQRDRLLKSLQFAEAVDQSFLQSGLRRFGLAAFGEPESDDLSGTGIDDGSQGAPMIFSAPDSCHVDCPTRVGCYGS